MSRDVTIDCGDAGTNLSARSIRVIDMASDGDTEVILVAATAVGETGRYITLEITSNRLCRAELTDTADNGLTTVSAIRFSTGEGDTQAPPDVSGKMRIMSIEDNSSSSSVSSSSSSSSS